MNTCIMTMGSVLSSSRGLHTEMKEGQKAVSHMKNDMMSRQVELVRRMAERQIAMQVAAVRETLLWFTPFTVTSYAFLYRGYRKTNSWVVMFPLIPITFGLGYLMHYAYGSKTNQIKALAENIMTNETYMMAVPEWSSWAQMTLDQEAPGEKVADMLPPPKPMEVAPLLTTPSLKPVEEPSPLLTSVSTGASLTAASNDSDSSYSVTGHQPLA